MWGTTGLSLKLYAHSNTKMYSQVCTVIQKTVCKHFGRASEKSTVGENAFLTTEKDIKTCQKR